MNKDNIKESTANKIGAYIKKKLSFLAECPESLSQATLAKLRKGIGMMPGEKPELYGFFLQDMPEEFWNNEGRITNEEWACYLALTLYSLHQQGNSPVLHNMHQKERESLGNALRRLAAAQGDSNAKERMQKKLQMVITSKDMGEFSHHLKGIITLLRGAGIPVNYVELAKDIYYFQFEGSKTKVSLKWGQDYFRKDKEETENE